MSHHSTPHRPQQGERRVPASASARLGGGSGNSSPHMHPQSNSAARAALQASALGAARESGSARLSGRGGEESDDYYVYGEDPARQLFQSPSVGGGGKGSRALTSREVAEQDELKTLFSRARHVYIRVLLAVCACVRMSRTQRGSDATRRRAPAFRWRRKACDRLDMRRRRGVGRHRREAAAQTCSRLLPWRVQPCPDAGRRGDGGCRRRSGR